MAELKGEILKEAATVSIASTQGWVNLDPSQPGLFNPSEADLELYGEYRLTQPALFPKPADVPDSHIAYNPSAIWTVQTSSGRCDIMYVRVEPDRSCSGSSHLGKAFARPYIVNPRRPATPLVAFADAMELRGEDPFLTTINRRLPSGKIQSAWLLGVVDVQPDSVIANRVDSLHTNFYVGESLDTLELVAQGPEGMKDIRVAQVGPDETTLEVWGRPQPREYSGNITHTHVPSIEELLPQTVTAAPFINEQLLPIGSGIWGGVNDVIKVGNNKYVLAAHRAYRTGDGTGRHYEAVLYGHDTAAKTIVELGVIATASMFPDGEVKDDATVDLHDVTFTGGAYNGKLQYLTFGVRDGRIGIGGVRQV